MKDFENYIPLPRAEIKELWESGIIVLDANVLLDLYRYTDKTREECLDVILKVKDQLWIPHQVALEFFTNRPPVILDQVSLLDDARQLIATLRKQADDEIRKLFTFRTHPILDRNAITKRITDTLDHIDADLVKQRDSYPDHLSADNILPRIEQVLSGRVGACLPDEELQKVYADGKARYERNTPPGYCDAKGSNKKEGNQVYGDFVVWSEVIKKARAEKKGVIFVTNDKKEDWWWIVHGKTIGCRPELREELRQKANAPLQIYSSELFMRYAKDHLKAKVTKEAIDEVKKVQGGLSSVLGRFEMMSDRLVQQQKMFDEIARESTASDGFRAMMNRSDQQQRVFDAMMSGSTASDEVKAMIERSAQQQRVFDAIMSGSAASDGIRAMMADRSVQRQKMVDEMMRGAIASDAAWFASLRTPTPAPTPSDSGKTSSDIPPPARTDGTERGEDAV